MQSLMEMFTQGANGKMVEEFARQYGLTTQQTTAAMEALMPAFSQGLKRNAGDPYGMLSFLNALSKGQHSTYYDDPAKAFGQQGMNEGNAILGHLFGSKELSRAVADQAAQATGISQQVLKAMLPAMAPMILGGLFKQMTGQMQQAQAAPQQAMANNPLGQVLEQMMGGGRANTGGSSNPLGDILEGMLGGKRSAPGNPGQVNPGAGNPWGDILEQMLGGGKATGRVPPSGPNPGQTDPGAGNPWGDILDQMLGGGRRPAEPARREEPVQRPQRRGSLADAAKGAGETAGQARGRQARNEEAPQPKRKGGYEDLFGDMFETGAKVQKEYNRGVESIFDQYLDGMRKR